MTREGVVKASAENVQRELGKARKSKEYWLPLTTDHWARIAFLQPLTEYEWQRLHDLLDAMRPAIVEPAP